MLQSIMRILRVMLSLVVAFSLFSIVQAGLPTSFAQKEWTVDNNGPADYNTIQKAVNVAAEGDTILVMPGTYNSTELDKKLDLVGQSSGGKVNFAVRISSLNVTKDASGSSVRSLYAPTVAVGTGAQNIQFEGVGGALSLSNSHNVSIKSGSGSIIATNVTYFTIQGFNGQVQGTALNHTSYSDSSGDYNIAGDNFAISSISGRGTIAANHVNMTSTVGTLTITGHTLSLKNSLLSSLIVSGAENSTFALSKFTGPITVGGKKLNFSDNEVNFGSLMVDSSAVNSTISGNNFLNSTVSVLAPGAVFEHNTVSNPFTNKSQTLPLPGSIYDVDFPAGATQITFTNNDVSGLEGVHFGSCAKIIKDNYVRWAGFRPYINDTLLVKQNGMQTTGLKLGDSAGSGCTNTNSAQLNGTRITLNKIAGFYSGVSIALDRSNFETNEVGANHTNIWVTGTNNTIVRNNFLGNGSAIDDGRDNKWFESIGNAGTGNYWKDWADNNANSLGGITRALALDGTGNNAVDKYPLARPVPLLEQTVVPEFSATSSMILVLGIAGAISLIAVVSRSKSGRQGGPERHLE